MKFTYTNKGGYSEIGQPNPIRWAILSGSPDAGFQNESSWLKCKDFFNDYVVAYNGGQRFGIYGFSTEGMKIPAKGEPVYMAVKDWKPPFLTNLDVLNQGIPEAVERHMVGEQLILEIPAYYFKNTYNISLLTLLIRLCNIDHTFETFEEFASYKQHAVQDQQLFNTVQDKGKFFNIPDHLKDYVWYAGAQFNDKVFKGQVYQLSSLVHNNGLVSWSTNF